MKKFSLLLFMLCIGFTSFAQEDRTIFGGQQININIGGFGGPSFKYTELNGQSTFSAGGGGGIVINDFFIGGHGTGISIESSIMENDELRDIELGYGGLWLGYSFWDRKAVHPFTSLKIGGGALDLYDANSNSNEPLTSNRVFVLEPEVGIELNLLQWFKLVGTVGYRNVNVGNTSVLSNADASGITAGITLRFGWFGGSGSFND